MSDEHPTRDKWLRAYDNIDYMRRNNHWFQR